MQDDVGQELHLYDVLISPKTGFTPVIIVEIDEGRNQIRGIRPLYSIKYEYPVRRPGGPYVAPIFKGRELKISKVTLSARAWRTQLGIKIDPRTFFRLKPIGSSIPAQGPMFDVFCDLTRELVIDWTEKLKAGQAIKNGKEWQDKIPQAQPL